MLFSYLNFKILHPLRNVQMSSVCTECKSTLYRKIKLYNYNGMRYMIALYGSSFEWQSMRTYFPNFDQLFTSFGIWLRKQSRGSTHLIKSILLSSKTFSEELHLRCYIYYRITAWIDKSYLDMVENCSITRIKMIVGYFAWLRIITRNVAYLACDWLQ